MWRDTLSDLEASMTRNMAQLRHALEEYESVVELNSKEVGLLRTIDAKLVRYAFDPRDLFVTIVEGVRELTGATLCDVLMPDSPSTLNVVWSTDETLIGQKVPISDSLTGQVFETGLPKLAPTVKGLKPYYSLVSSIQSELAVPLKDQFGGVVGVINVESVDVDYFTEHHQDLITTVAGQAAIGLQNANLYKQFLAVLDIFAIIRSESESLEKVLSIVGDQAQHLIQAEQCQVLAVFGDELVIVFTTGVEARGTTRVKIEDSVSGLALTRGNTVRYDDISHDPEARRYYKDVLGGMRSELAVPIIWKDNHLGVINLESPRVAAFSEHDAKLLEVFATQAAVAIMNAKHLQELGWSQQARAELWALAQVGDVYGPLIHKINGDAGAITANLSEIRFKYHDLLVSDRELSGLLDDMEEKANLVLQVPARLQRQLESVTSYSDIDVTTLVRKVISEIGNHNDIVIEPELLPVPAIWISPQIEEVVENILRNAIEALPGGGTIWIGTGKWVTTPRSAEPIVSGVEVTVTDTCGGIPSERLATLWEIDRTTKSSAKKRHLGFGLWWVKAYVERMGGTVTVDPRIETASGTGCRFTVRLPMKARQSLEMVTDSAG